VFLLFGAVARRGGALAWGGDPVPQALLITGIVVAFSATALAVTLLLRLADEADSVTLASDARRRPTGAARMVAPLEMRRRPTAPARAAVLVPL
jgi:multicomponent Na+:H+ antiporter subunit C